MYLVLSAFMLGPVTGLSPCLSSSALSGNDRARCLCVGKCSVCVVARVGLSRRRSRESDSVCVRVCVCVCVFVLVLANEYKEQM